MSPPTVFGALFLLVGGVLFLIGLRLVGPQVARGRSWRRDRATVVGYDWRGAGEHSTQHWILERTDAYGRTHRGRSTLGMSHGTMRPMPFEVDVLVDPHDESSFVLASGLRSGWGGLAFVMAGSLFVSVGVVVLVMLR